MRRCLMLKTGTFFPLLACVVGSKVVRSSSATRLPQVAHHPLRDTLAEAKMAAVTAVAAVAIVMVAMTVSGGEGGGKKHVQPAWTP